MATKDKLSSVSVEAAKPRKKPYKLSDGGGLYLLVNPDGSRWWRLKYRVDGREKLLSLGIYPAKSLKAVNRRPTLTSNQRPRLTRGFGAISVS